MTIMKKLKLTGTPYKIYKKTAFIQVSSGMLGKVFCFEGICFLAAVNVDV